jgi:Predicted signal transduction protein with a C-terminal ATPase domain
MRTLRSVSLVLGVWVAFFGLQIVLSIALGRRGPSRLAAQIEIDLAVAVLWATLSFAIARWHRWVRNTAPGVLALLALHLPMLCLAALADTAVTEALIRAADPAREITPFWALLVYYSDFDTVSYVAVVAVAEALLVRRALLGRQRLAKRLEASLSRARLDSLEAQLHPHFLFNSLGAVSELAYDAPATANRVLQQLISIFRTSLARKSDEVTLGEEIVGIEPYLDIQRIRFADWLTIDYHVDDAAVDCLLPRFILQPLVENAIRHGLSGRSAAGTIDIAATVVDGSLIVRVSDNGVGLDGSASTGGRGIGLANVRDRLAIMYGDDDRLRLANSGAGGTIAEVTIPARRREGQAPVPEIDARGITTSDGALPVLRVPRLLRNPVVSIALTWLLCGLVWTQQSFVYLQMRGRLGDVSWLSIARNDLTSALIWAILTPVVMAVAWRFPIRADRAPLRIAAFLSGGAITAVVHVQLLQRLTAQTSPLLSANWQLTLIVDFVIYCVLVAIGHRGVLLAWLRAREAAAAELTTAVAAAQARAAKLQVIPPVLLRSLGGISQTVRRDPELTERQLTRLADYLRLALESTDEEGMTPERERALESAVAALRDSGAYSHDFTLSA